jgi:hypothetical protein
VNSKEGNSLDFCQDFVQEFGLFMRSSAGHIDQRGDNSRDTTSKRCIVQGRSGHLGLGHILESRKAPLSQFKFLFASFELIKHTYSISQVVFIALGSVLYVYIFWTDGYQSRTTLYSSHAH